MKQLYLVLLMLLAAKYAFAQQPTTLSGVVQSQGSEKIEGYTAVLLNTADSLSITWKYCKTDVFQLAYDAAKYKAVTLYVSSFGYKDMYVNVESDKTDLGTIVLEAQQHKIDDVVVKGYTSVSHNFIRGKDEFTIPASIAERETSLYSLLGQIPGIDVSGDNAVKIIGTGTPTFTINGLTPRPGELAALAPDMIDKVVINRMPSAKFDKNVVGVLDIITKKTLRDFLSIRVTDTFKQSDVANNNASVEINSKIGKWNNFVSYGNGYSPEKFGTDYRMTVYAANTIHQQNTLGVQDNKALSHNIIFSPKIDLTENSFIDLQYSFSHSNLREQHTNVLNFVDRELNKSSTRSNDKSDNHDIVLRYRNKFNNNSGLTFNVGYSNNATMGNSKIQEAITPHTEEVPSSIETEIDSKFKSQTATASVDYDFVLFKKLDVNVGGRYAMLMNDSYSYYPITSTDYTSSRRETQAALYLSISQGWKKFSYQLGLREEYRYVHHAANKDENKNPYDFMPSLGLSYRINNKINMTLYLRRISIYPSISELNPTISYVNKYQYYTGNPDLKPTVRNEISYRLSLPQNLSVNISYTNSNDQILQMNEIDRNDEAKTYSTYVNLDKQNYFSSTLSWWKKIKFYRVMANFSYTYCSSKLPFQNEPERSNDPSLSFRIQNIFNISNNIYAMLTGWYNSPFDSTTVRVGQQYGLDAGVNFSLLKKKLRIFVQGQNLLYRNANYKTRYGQIYSNDTNISQSRCFRIAITYNFNNFKDLFKKNDANSDIIDRAN